MKLMGLAAKFKPFKRTSVNPMTCKMLSTPQSVLMAAWMFSTTTLAVQPLKMGQ